MTWPLDEVYLKIDGRMVYLWRAIDAEGEVLDVLVQIRRNKRAALKLMRYGFVPDKLVTDDHALAKGIDDFSAMPSSHVFLGLIYPIALLCLGGYAMHLLFPLMAGFALVGPARKNR
jgi:DDE domain